MTLSPLGDAAVVMTLGSTIDDAVAARVHALAAEIERHPPRGVTDVVAAFASVAVFYDVTQFGGFDRFCEELHRLAQRADAGVVSDASLFVEIPVCYGGEFGADLREVASAHDVSEAQAIALHSGAEYRVHAIGFAPGFPYLGGLPEQLATPRRSTPREQVPAGSVGIGGAQTGIYPLATPGGWNLIGRTPLRLFDPLRTPPALLRAGDRVKFRAIDGRDFAALAPAPVAETRSEPVAPTGIEVVRSGLFTTVQDLGRRGHRGRGVVQSGAADPFALRLANLLVGNPDDAAGLELTLLGPELRFSHDSLVALGGADFLALPRWQPVFVQAGTVLTFGHARAGCRGYLAVAGGIDVPLVLGSRSTYVRAEIGGLRGRALRDGDTLPVPATPRHAQGRWHVDERIVPAYSTAPVLRVLRGAHADQFGRALFDGEFKVTAHSDRMGVRVAGAPLTRNTSAELISSAVAPGTIQVPPDGNPIVLLADAQTIGGYPQIAHVIAVDQPLAAQLRPGDRVTFVEVTLAEAHELALARERVLAMVREGLAQKFH
jgi:KipI family sensor histidine kinase inhibitor